MKKRRRNEHGAITVFLSMVLIVIIAFMGMLVDISRMRVAEAQAKRASQLAMDSIMTSYSKRLREDYGLYGYAGGESGVNETFLEYFNANLQPAAEEEQGEFVELIKTITGGDEVKYGDMLNLTASESASASGDYPLTEPDALYQQVIEFSKFRVPLTLALTNKLGKVTQMQETLQNVNNDTAAYDRINDLGEPVDEYMKDQKSLMEAVQDLSAAVQTLAVWESHWKNFIDGKATEKLVSASYRDTVTYSEFQPRYDSDNFISGAKWASGSTQYPSGSVSAVPYTADSTIKAFMSKRDDIHKDLVALSMDWFERAYENEDDYLWDLYEKYVDEELSEEAVAELEERIDFHDDTVWGWMEDARAQASANTEAAANQILELLMDEFEEALDSLTNAYFMEYKSALDDVYEEIANVRKCITELSHQRTNVNKTIDGIDQSINTMKADGKISDEVRDNWEADKPGDENDGEKVQTQKYLEEDEKEINKILDAIGNLENQMQTATTQYNTVKGSDCPGLFMWYVRTEVNGGNSSWESDMYHMAEVTYGTYYYVFEDEADFITKKGEGDEKNNKANEELDKMKDNEKEQPERYNPNNRIPDELKEGFVGGAAADDKDTKSKLANDPKNVTASQVKSTSSSQSGGLNDIVDMLGNGLQYIIGTVYTSEYILAMFSNAAPELETEKQGSYDKSTFEYNRVTTLRNAVPVGYDQVEDYKEYENVRTGYFYNAEVEYILFGCDNEETNVNKTQLMLEIILLASNYLQVRNNDVLKGIVNAAAAAGMSIGIPSIVTRFLMYTAFSVTETAFDIFYLMRGYEIPALSTKGDLLFMMNIGGENRILGSTTELMISYEFYLRLRVMLAVFLDRGDTMQRMANLIQLNINYQGEGSKTEFKMSEAYTTFRAKASAKMPYWFMTMAMMGEARSDSRWYEIPEHEIVASY